MRPDEINALKPLELYRQARDLAAELVARHGEHLLPAFLAMEAALAAEQEKQALRSSALERALSHAATLKGARHELQDQP